jgi:hypothetical protein
MDERKDETKEEKLTRLQGELEDLKAKLPEHLLWGKGLYQRASGNSNPLAKD